MNIFASQDCSMKIKLFLLLILISFESIGKTFPKKDTITVYKVYEYIKCSGILHPEIVLRQAVWETGWFKSRHALEKNNLFGFRYSKKYMSFENWQSCINYYKSWQERKYTNKDEDYYKFLIRIKYATSAKYISCLKSLRLEIPQIECNEK
jgi:hypothetical protein